MYKRLKMLIFRRKEKMLKEEKMMMMRRKKKIKMTNMARKKMRTMKMISVTLKRSRAI
jgi:hypothetical protein